MNNIIHYLFLAGLVVSLFTSISVTRLLMEWRLRGRTRGTLTLPGPDWLGAERRRRPIRFMAVRGRGIVLSLVLSVASLGALAWPGLNTGIDFQGGVAMEVHTPATIDTLRGGLAASGLEGSLQRFDIAPKVVLDLTQLGPCGEKIGALLGVLRTADHVKALRVASGEEVAQKHLNAIAEKLK